MAEYAMLNQLYTPEELARFKAQVEQNYQNGALQNQNMNTVANMTKNLSPAANLGIMLGTLGGRWAANQYNNLQRIQAEKDNQLQNLLFKNGGLAILNLPDSFQSATASNTFQTQAPNPALLDAGNSNANVPPNNATPSTALFANNNPPSYDWRHQHYWTNYNPSTFATRGTGFNLIRN